MIKLKKLLKLDKEQEENYKMIDIKFIEEYTKELEKKSKKDLINLVISNEVMILTLENMYKTEEQKFLENEM